MNFLDIAIALPLIYGLYRGFKRGFIMEVFTFLAWILGFYIAFNFSDSISATFVDESSKDQSYLPSLVFLIVLLGVGIGVYALGKIIEKTAKISMLSLPNKLAGLILGFLKFLYLAGAILLLISSIPNSQSFISKENKSESLLFPFATSFVSNTIPGVTSTFVYNYHKND